MALDVRAIVFAGGEGARLNPLVSDGFPKALVPVANRPMIFYPLFSLLRAGITDIIIVAPPASSPELTHYVNAVFLADPRVLDLKLPPQELSFEIICSGEGFDTADVLRSLPKTDSDCIVMSCDYVGNINLEETIHLHRSQKAACTVTMLAATPSPKFEADTYALVDASGSRLLGLYFNTDLDAGVLKVRGTLLEKFPKLHLRSDVADTHVYMLAPWVMHDLLRQREAISSVKFDLVPYLARRQFTLARSADLNPRPGSDIRVCCRIESAGDHFATRVNTIEALLSANAAVAKGMLDSFLPGAPSKDKNANAKKLARKGDKTSVSADSVIGAQVTTGDRTSVKKSAVGDAVSMGSQVKLNGCVICSEVSIADGVNLNSTIVGRGASIQEGCKLKDCQVGPYFVVAEGTEATGEKLSAQRAEKDDSDLDDFISFA